ncbi:MAG: hypothetical protein CL854_00335 [Cryomorphaceae bacterium]|nr:hypothetical protein [Cryomorphaceae bacterium]|tara:strand:- start:2011 stop:2790 length:780 start_codon:yes stop_codon:yes gene_type:complete
MKTTTFLVAAGLLAISCAAPQEDLVSAPEPPILADGAYSLDKAVWTFSDSSTTIEQEQIKIYSGGRYMFASWNAAEKTPSFAAGTVETRNGKLYETPVYDVNGAVDSGMVFELSIVKTTLGFEQEIKGMQMEDSSSIDLIESWNALEGNASPYDGLWKLSSRNEVEGVSDFNEIKMIGGGHFVWFHAWSDDSTEHADFGYGAFIDNGDGNVTEVVQAGSIEGYVGEWSVNYAKVGADMIQQTYVNVSTGEEFVQNYKRL